MSQGTSEVELPELVQVIRASRIPVSSSDMARLARDMEVKTAETGYPCVPVDTIVSNLSDMNAALHADTGIVYHAALT